MELSDFDVLSFDCYGTLIDWETGILQSLRSCLRQTHQALSDNVILETFAAHEHDQQNRCPTMLYPDILYNVYKRLANNWKICPCNDDALKFSQSIKNWPVFADTVNALNTLKKYYKIVILSNVDNISFRASNTKLGTSFDEVLTAEDIGSYKPNIHNFEYMLAKLASLGIGANNLLHTAQSLFHDHVPAKQLGIATCWIDRKHRQEGWGATLRPSFVVQPNFHFYSLQEMARARECSL